MPGLPLLLLAEGKVGRRAELRSRRADTRVLANCLCPAGSAPVSCRGCSPGGQPCEAAGQGRSSSVGGPLEPVDSGRRLGAGPDPAASLGKAPLGQRGQCARRACPLAGRCPLTWLWGPHPRLGLLPDSPPWASRRAPAPSNHRRAVLGRAGRVRRLEPGVQAGSGCLTKGRDYDC